MRRLYWNPHRNEHGLPGRAGRHDPASSVARIALLFALPASLSRTRPSHPVSAWSFRNEFLAAALAADAEGVPVRVTEVELPDPPRLVLRLQRDLVAELTRSGVRRVELLPARQ